METPNGAQPVMIPWSGSTDFLHILTPCGSGLLLYSPSSPDGLFLSLNTSLIKVVPSSGCPCGSWEHHPNLSSLCLQRSSGTASGSYTFHKTGLSQTPVHVSSLLRVCQYFPDTVSIWPEAGECERGTSFSALWGKLHPRLLL